MENNNDVAIIRKWYDVKTGSYVRDWTAEEYKKLSSDEHILEEYDDGDLIECYCKEERMWKISNLLFTTTNQTYTYNNNTNFWI